MRQIEYRQHRQQNTATATDTIMRINTKTSMRAEYWRSGLEGLNPDGRTCATESLDVAGLNRLDVAGLECCMDSSSLQLHGIA